MIRSVTPAPSSPPTPTADSRMPTPESPQARYSSATTTIRTFRPPTTSVWTEVSATSNRSEGSAVIARKPAVAWRIGCSSASAGAWRAPNTDADHKCGRPQSPAAVTANATSTLVAASISAPSAGPANIVTLSIVLVATFAAVSSSGSRATEGRSARCAGSNAVASAPLIGGEREHERGGRVDQHDERREPRGRGTAEIGDHHHPLAGEAVRDQACEGREYRRRREPQEQGHSHELGAAHVVGVDGNRHAVGPLGSA